MDEKWRLSNFQISVVLAKFDQDGDGKLSYAEFKKLLKKWNISYQLGEHISHSSWSLDILNHVVFW